MRHTLLLFDVDGTLIHSGGVGKRALQRSTEVVFGRGDAFEGVEFAGRTDPAIVSDALRAIEVEPDPAVVAALLERYLEILHQVLDEGPPPRPCAGVETLLETLHSISTCSLGLGTGNIEAGARAKLVAAGIYNRFKFGGFGSDAVERSEVLQIAAERGTRQLQTTPSIDAAEDSKAPRLVVIGDTPADHRAAQAIGAECFLVATGPFSLAELRGCEPDGCFENLDSPEVIESLLKG